MSWGRAATLATLFAGTAVAVLPARGRLPDRAGAAARPAASASHAPRDLREKGLHNPAPYIPAQCYARTKDDAGRAHNGCYVCHQAPAIPNFTDDRDLQVSLDFPEPARKNHWRSSRAPTGAEPTPEQVRRYVREDNYLGADGAPVLARLLAHPPARWDADGDGRFAGFVPDAYFRFDERGFDHDAAGAYTGWRAYASAPFPGAFLPTNGSAGDTLIRLPEPFRKDESGRPDIVVYTVNLAIVEALIARRDVALDAVDERRLGVDLDGNGTLGRAQRVRFDWAPREGRTMSYVGRARLAQRAGETMLAAGLFPPGTEFLHSVRYLDETGGKVTLARRMKELRYAKKRRYRNYSELQFAASRERKETHDYPDRVRQLFGNVERGVNNGLGWVYQGFIEDAAGELRPQTFEETGFCVGCHGGIGATTDGTFSFARKLGDDAFQRGWFHPSQHGLEGIADRLLADGRREYATYLEKNGAGDDFRENDEVLARFFERDGSLRKRAVEDLSRDISTLVWPSPARARALNRSYLSLVRAQSFVLGRGPLPASRGSVLETVAEGQQTGIEGPFDPREAPRAPFGQLRADSLGRGSSG